MAARIIEVIAAENMSAKIREVAEANGADDVIVGALTDDGRRVVRIACGRLDRQKLLDVLQMTLSTTSNWRIIILPVEATLPKVLEDNTPKELAKTRKPAGLSREELEGPVGQGADFDTNFVVLAILSAIVAAIGLMSDSVAVVIGAMVIAPFLGPNLALAFGAAVGDMQLIFRAVKTNLAGVCMTLALAISIGLIFDKDLTSTEIMSRTEVNLASIAVAMASGAAAALSLTTGLSATLVGVMVAVALLPPATVIGIMVGWAEYGLAGQAALLLAVNVVCINLSAQLVFLVKGIRPRTWFDAERARVSTWINIGIWTALLLALAAIIIFETYLAGFWPME